MAQNARKSASELFDIEDDAIAFDFDRACNFRLLVFENKRDEAKAKRLAYEVGKIFLGESDE